MNERYARQSILPEIGPDGQARISASRVLCVGAGGLGCASLPYLAGAGIGRITIIDPDAIERSNLQRQVLYGESDLGRPKAEAAAGKLSDLNPDIEIRALSERLDAGNAASLFGDHDLVIDGSDNFAAKYLSGDASVKFGVPLVYGSATGMEAMVTLFLPGDGPCLRCLFQEQPTGWVPNCAEAGVLGPLVGAAGCAQAVEAIKYLAGGRDAVKGSLAGRLWLMDARDLSVRRLTFGQRPDCPACSHDPAAIELIDTPASIREIGADELAALDDVQLVDVREPDEFARGHLPDAINRPLSALTSGQAAMPETGLCVVYCASGVRSRKAIELARARSAAEFRSLRGGFEAS